jgi:hypothetical protein
MLPLLPISVVEPEVAFWGRQNHFDKPEVTGRPSNDAIDQ